MQKILRRVATAERVAAKRRKAKGVQFFKKEKKKDTTEHRQQISVAREDFEGAKQSIRDDWKLGPLAPRTDVGDWAGASGAIHEARYKAMGKLPLVKRNERCAWAGGAYNLNLVINDRVVLVDGPDKGRIGKILEIDEDQAEVTVENLNKSNVRVQAEIRRPEDPSALNIEIPIPISAVRLVHPIKNPETGVTRDVIINQLVHRDILHDKVSGKTKWSRIVPGLNISIPWPIPPEENVQDFAGDTVRIHVEEKTFIPSLLRPPMPETVIDELRGKYSRFRTRHEPEYIAKLEAAEQAKEDRKKLMDSMRTPLQELHRAERANKKKKGKPRLTVEMLEKIGEVIAKNRARTLNAAGVSDVSSRSPPPAATSAEVEVPPPNPTEPGQESATPPPST